jgi:ATP-dependent DNA ligase
MTEIPLFASLATEVFDLSPYAHGGRDYAMQAKFDGHRVLIDYRGRLPKVLNRNGKAYSARPFVPKIPDYLMGTVLDCEYMWQERGREHVKVFDLLKSPEDSDLTYERSWIDRHGLLYSLLIGLGDPAFQGVQTHSVAAHTLELCRAMSRDSKFLPVDGVVIKNIAKPYVPGKYGDWVKYKFTNDIDCVVTNLRIDDKSNCELSVQDSTGNIFPIGKASTAGRRVKVNSVVTVRFLKLTEGMRLREPRIVDVRDDKAPRDCGVEQLIPFVPSLAEQMED